jgi:hypothetical protein
VLTPHGDQGVDGRQLVTTALHNSLPRGWEGGSVCVGWGVRGAGVWVGPGWVVRGAESRTFVRCSWVCWPRPGADPPL